MKGAYVTGGGRGIGKAVASELASQGFSVLLVARTESELGKTAAEIQEQFPKVSVLTLAGDVSDSGFVTKSFQAAVKAFGSVEVVFNNAAMYQVGSTDLTTEDFSRLIDVNLKGAFAVAKVAMEHFTQMKKGYLMNVSSVCGITGFAGVGGYTASKFGLQGLNESLFREFAPQGIKVTALCPSWVNTKMASQCPFPRDSIIQPEDIAKTVAYLLSLSPGACPKEVIVECTKSPL